MSSTMGAPSMLENGNAVQSRRSTWGFRGASYVLIFVWVISALVPIIFCLLYHQQARGICWAHGYLNGSSTRNEDMSWIWNSDNCKGVVQDEGKYLIIQQTGKYFIYAQLFRKNTTTAPLSLMLFRDSNTTLTNALGYENGTINFARPFLLNKGDKLHLEQNDDNLKYVLENQTYWGLFKM